MVSDPPILVKTSRRTRGFPTWNFGSGFRGFDGQTFTFSRFDTVVAHVNRRGEGEEKRKKVLSDPSLLRSYPFWKLIGAGGARRGRSSREREREKESPWQLWEGGML